jgi:hypothetical protein
MIRSCVSIRTDNDIEITSSANMRMKSTPKFLPFRKSMMTSAKPAWRNYVYDYPRLLHPKVRHFTTGLKRFARRESNSW